MQSSSQGPYPGYPGYQGYPYVNPVVTDVPSIDPATAARLWTNLPRRPVQMQMPVRVVAGPSGAGSSSQVYRPQYRPRTPQTPATSRPPLIHYTPRPAQTPFTPRPGQSPQITSPHRPAQSPRDPVPPKDDIDANPVVYIDIPEAGGSEVSRSLDAPGTSTPRRPQSPSSPRDSVPLKEDIDANPVVYIDIPEAGTGSEVSRSIETPGSDQPELVEETIMYDPFDNRRIDVPKDVDARSTTSSTSESSYAGYTDPNTRQNLASPGGSGSQSQATTSRPEPVVPPFMSKESLVYGGDGADGFPLSPIPISEFPEPPPAYTEMAAITPIQNVSVPQNETQRSEPPPPPRTQVIVAADPVSSGMGAVNFDRKNLICHHCGMRVHTLVVKEIGYLTHVIACIVFIFLMPLVLMVYISDTFKYKNHYCPNCNRMIGYQTPLVGQKVNYVT